MQHPEHLVKVCVTWVELMGALGFGDGKVPEVGSVVHLCEAGADHGEGTVGSRALGQPGGYGGGPAGRLAEDRQTSAPAGGGVLEDEGIVQCESEVSKCDARDRVVLCCLQRGLLGTDEEIGKLVGEAVGLRGDGSVEAGVVEDLLGIDGGDDG